MQEFTIGLIYGVSLTRVLLCDDSGKLVGFNMTAVESQSRELDIRRSWAWYT